MKRCTLVSLLLVFLFSCDSAKQEGAELDQVIAEVNSKCPLLLDSETEFNGVELVNERTIQYNYTLINASLHAIDTHQFNLVMWPGILSTIKVSSEMARLREQQMIIQYFYQDKYKKPIYTFRIKPEHYAN